jgi:S1-C subfamily serine protease
VTSVEELSPAARAGVLPRDLVVSVGGVPVTTVDDLHRRMTESAIGTATEMVVFRAGMRRQFDIVPTERR